MYTHPANAKRFIHCASSPLFFFFLDEPLLADTSPVFFWCTMNLV